MRQKQVILLIIILIAALGLMGASSPSQPFLTEEDFLVRLHPENALYVGDMVSFEVIAFNENINMDEHVLHVKVLELEQDLGSTGFYPFGIGGRYQATLWWVWDTEGLEAGTYTLEFRINEQLSWTQEILLQAAVEKPVLELETGISMAETDNCIIYYYENSAADLDLEDIIEIADTEAAAAVSQMMIDFTEPIEVLLMPRVLGHGGFAAGELYISYLDRDYTGGGLDIVLHHEMIHELDARLGGDLRPTILVEGLAVYQSGGHFKTEPITPRAAALVQLGWYIPLAELSEDFYFQQHEITYLEAAALVEYMVERWGYEAYDAFYRDIHAASDGLNGTAISAGLEKHFGLTLEDLDKQFYLSLMDYYVPVDMIEDIQLTVAYFNTVRLYQQHLDPSAYFLTAWLPNIYSMLDYEYYADLLRHPDDLTNLAIETMLINAYDDLYLGKYQEADRLLGEINTILLEIEREQTVGWADYKNAGTYYQVLATLEEAGYEPQQVEINETSARAIALDTGRMQYERIIINLSLEEESWQIVDITE